MAAKAVQISRILWTDPTEIQQGLASGEIVAAYSWNDTIKNLTDQGIPIAYAKPKEGYFTWFCGLTLLNSGKADPALAYDFIDAWLSPETGKALIEGSGLRPCQHEVLRGRCRPSPLSPWASRIRSST